MPRIFCDWCAKWEEPEYAARVYFGIDTHPNTYCRNCLEIVKENMKDVPHVKENGIRVDYPFTQEGSDEEK